MVCALCLAAVSGGAHAQTTATWSGPASGNYNDSTNWSTAPQVPINGGGNTYNVEISGAFDVNFDVPGAGNQVSGFQLSGGSVFTVGPTFGLEVINGATLDGLVTVNGGSFVANDAASTLDGGNARLAADGGTLAVGAAALLATRNA